MCIRKCHGVFVATFAEIIGQLQFEGSEAAVVGVSEEQSGDITVPHICVAFGARLKAVDVGADGRCFFGVMELASEGF